MQAQRAMVIFFNKAQRFGYIRLESANPKHLYFHLDDLINATRETEIPPGTLVTIGRISVGTPRPRARDVIIFSTPETRKITGRVVQFGQRRQRAVFVNRERFLIPKPLLNQKRIEKGDTVTCRVSRVASDRWVVFELNDIQRSNPS
ncbi:hypothetical protein HY065_01280 [Candidatus Berkelbacteria bacterium]|nr:hypothetical protein [Candidatus Berkelbacteria bacterium]